MGRQKKSSKSKASSKKRKNAKRSGVSWRRLLFRGVLYIGLLVTLIGGVWVAQLDHRLTSWFEGRRWALPAKVYARPVELFSGQSLSLDDLLYELKTQQYQRVGRVTEPGQYALIGSHLTLFTRAFDSFDGGEPERKLHIEFEQNRIASLKVLSGAESAFIRLSPTVIGGIYPKRKEDRELIRLSDIPPLMGEAIIAVEDRDFVNHHGLSFRGIARAMWVNMQSGRWVQGGSTLTQQLVKNLFLTQERRLSRKINEAVLALLMDARYSKAEILETYLNEVYLGQASGRQVHGFGLASRHYFRKPVGDLQLHEQALLVGLVKGASYYNPWRHPERAMERRNLVLQLMAEQGLITDADHSRFSRQPLGVVNDKSIVLYEFPAFIDLVKTQLATEYSDEDLSSEGLNIYTTLSIATQRQVERALQKRLSDIERQKGLPEGELQAAGIVTAVGVGEVEALVGGREPRYSGFNRAINAYRQIGSLAKPAVYLSALRSGNWTMASVISDGKVTVEGPDGERWSPANFDNQSHGDVLFIDALTNSYNRATARLGMEVGLQNVADTYRDLGYRKAMNLYPAMLLGATEMSPFEVTQIYHTLANDGVRVPIRAILGVSNTDGELLSRYPLEIAQSVDAHTASLLQFGLQAVMHEGTGRSAYQTLSSELAVAGKTGTTNQSRDSWFAGFSGQHLGVIWVGYDDNRASNLTGASGALKVWTDIFAALNTRPLDVYQDDGVEYLWVDAENGLLSGENCQRSRLLPFDTQGGVMPERGSACIARENPVWFWMKRWLR